MSGRAQHAPVTACCPKHTATSQRGVHGLVVQAAAKLHDSTAQVVLRVQSALPHTGARQRSAGHCTCCQLHAVQIALLPSCHFCCSSEHPIKHSAAVPHCF